MRKVWALGLSTRMSGKDPKLGGILQDFEGVLIGFHDMLAFLESVGGICRQAVPSCLRLEVVVQRVFWARQTSEVVTCTSASLSPVLRVRIYSSYRKLIDIL